MAEELTPEQEEMLAKARATSSTTIPVEDEAKPVTPTRMQGVDEWGPYFDTDGKPDYKIVTTPTGEYGVPPGKILYFVDKEVFSARERRMITIKVPRHRRPEEEPEV